MDSGALQQKTEPTEPTKIWTKPFVSLFFANLAFNLGMAMSNSLISVYANSLGATASTIGILMATFTVSSVLLRLVSSPIMDTYNRKYIVVFAALTLAIAFFGFSLSKNVPTMILFRLLQGTGMAFGNACCLAMVSEILPKDRYSSGIGYFSLALTMCLAAGPAIGITLASWVGYNMAFATNAVIMLLSAFLTIQIKSDFKRVKKLKLTVNNILAREAFLPSFMMLLLTTGNGTVSSFLIIFAGNRGIASSISLYFVTNALVMLIARPLVGKLIDRIGVVKVIVPAFLCNVLSFILIASAHTLPAFLLAAAVSALGQGSCQPAMMALSMKSVPVQRRGVASSTNYIGMDLGSLIGPVLAGNVAQAFGFVTMWHVMIAPFVVGLASMLLFRKSFTRIEKNFAQK